MKILKWLGIIQEVSNRNRNPKLGRGFNTAYRFNPYNPLSYIAVILLSIIGIILYGFIGFWQRNGLKNPFKWD